MKEATSAGLKGQLFDIYDEKTGASRAKVTPLIIACFEGDYDTIKFLLQVTYLFLYLFNNIFVL